MSRIERLAALLELPLLVTSGVNVRYLTGMSSSNAALLVDPGGEAILFTDFRYAKKAKTVEDVTFEQTARAVIGDLATRLAGQTIGVEAHVLTVTSLESLRAGGVDAQSTSGLVERLRTIKEPAELESLRQAAAISDAVFGALGEERFAGRTELELAWRVRGLFNEHGSSELSFDTMVAAADNGASPHSDNRDVAVPANTLVIVDAGCRVDSYASDCTRTFAAGPLSGELREAYDACVEGQLAGLEAVRPRVTGAEADAAARSAIVEAGFGEAFGHGLGHGVGLLVHEAPRLSTESTDTLAATNVVTVEPGVYFPGSGGVRIEDLVVVREEGAEVLTTFTKELVEVE